MEMEYNLAEEPEIVTVRKKNGSNVWGLISLITACVSFMINPLCLVSFGALVTGIVGLIFGILKMRGINCAIIGVVLSIVIPIVKIIAYILLYLLLVWVSMSFS